MLVTSAVLTPPTALLAPKLMPLLLPDFMALRRLPVLGVFPFKSGMVVETLPCRSVGPSKPIPDPLELTRYLKGCGLLPPSSLGSVNVEALSSSLNRIPSRAWCGSLASGSAPPAVDDRALLTSLSFTSLPVVPLCPGCQKEADRPRLWARARR